MVVNVHLHRKTEAEGLIIWGGKGDKRGGKGDNSRGKQRRLTWPAIYNCK